MESASLVHEPIFCAKLNQIQHLEATLRTVLWQSYGRLLPALAYMALSFTTVVAQEKPKYRMGAGDVVRIQVLNHPELSLQTTLDRDGSLLLPQLDTTVNARNLTESDLSDQLTRLYRTSDPTITQVRVNVVEFKSRSVRVTGEVKAQGLYGFPEIPDVYSVILEAGGPTAIADMTRVQVFRKGEIIPVDVSAFQRGEKTLPDLLPGDQIFVPAQASEVAVTGAQFQVLGSVRVPGVYPWNEAQSVYTALALSGGPLPEANLRKVSLARVTPTGLVSYELDVEAMLFEGKTDVDIGLEQGDTITIKSKAFGPGTLARGLVLFLPLITTLTSLIVVIDNQ